jgi:uncharacterized membrane-anchored protein YhcB (DUF1043 family)
MFPDAAELLKSDLAKEYIERKDHLSESNSNF